MPTTKKANVTQQSHEPHTNGDPQQSEQRRESLSDSEKDGKKKKKEGYSILSGLAKFMSHEKSETPSDAVIEEHPNENDNTETDIDSEGGGSEGPEYVEVSSQTSEISVRRRSSTLQAISKAVEALKEVRRRVTELPKNNEDSEMERLHLGKTETSSYYALPNDSESDFIVHHDPHLMLKNRHLSTDSFAPTHHHSVRREPHIENLSASEPRTVSEQSLRRHPHHHDQPQTHVSFSENQVHDRSIHPEEIYTASSRERFSNDDSLYNNDEVLFHSTPKPGKGNPRKKYPNQPFVKNANFQTEPVMEMKGTQTASPSRIMENDIDDDTNTAISLNDLSADDVDTTVLAHRLLADREKCSKCDLFELMFLHEGEKMLNDRDAVEMFTRHMNSHLRKAKQESKKADSSKPKPRMISEAEHLHDVLSISQLGSNENMQRAAEMSFQHDDNPNVLDSRRNEFTRDPIKNKTNASSQKRQIKDREKNMARTSGESKGEKLVNSKESLLSQLRRKQKKSKNARDRSILYNYLFKNGENCSEEVIIQHKNCKRERNIDNGYQDNNEDERFEREVAGNASCINCTNHRNSERIKCRHVVGWCNNCNCWNKDCTCNDPCNYQCSATEFCSLPSTDHSHRKKLSSKEKRFKWLVKGMLAVLKGYHGVKRKESDDTKTKSQPKDEKKEDAKVGHEDKLEEEKTPGAIPETAATTAETPPKSSPVEETNPPSSEEQTPTKKREGSVLSDIAFFMVKDEENKESEDTEKKEEGVDKPDVKNKPSPAQESISSSSPDEKLVADLLSNWVRNGKICSDRKKPGSSGDEDGKSPKNFDLKDPKVQKFVQDILTAFCSEVLKPTHKESSSTQGSECDYVNDIGSSCPSSDSEEMTQQFCGLIKAATKQTSPPNARPPRKNSDAMAPQGRGTTNESRNTSYFYPFCNNNNNNAATFNTQFSYCRSSFGGSCCSTRGHGNTNTNYCAFPTQDNCRRNNTASCNRAKMRQECVESSRRKRDSQQRPRKQSQAKSTRNPIPRHFTRDNPLCVCNLTGGNSNNQQGDVCDAFTYVVPQAQMFWRCPEAEQNE